MTEKTRGVVLCIIPYNDRTRFVHIYTERFGKISCKLTAAKSRRTHRDTTLYAPLSLLDLVVESNARQDLFSIVEATLLQSPYALSMTDPGKTAQCIYMAELLEKTIGEVEPNQRLWQLISHSIELLPYLEKGSANFHLIFTTRLCYLLGFSVDNDSYQDGMQFDIAEGIYTQHSIMHPYYLTAESAKWLHKLLDTGFSTLADLSLSRQQRNTLLDMMLTFLKLHLPDAGEIRSVQVLKELFD